ncbi:hypothetical protein CDAR_444141 [Caerostris darwini]|uniref:Uncharacterized protein n=1 Tax=Caerostris darwini TaxID=1538125 RepID=A0AAV4X799_9ARAC|nr:hypothetical protein CDAR_444141 [Caerostris darwini]
MESPNNFGGCLSGGISESKNFPSSPFSFLKEQNNFDPGDFARHFMMEERVSLSWQPVVTCLVEVRDGSWNFRRWKKGPRCHGNHALMEVRKGSWNFRRNVRTFRLMGFCICRATNQQFSITNIVFGTFSAIQVCCSVFPH